MNRFYAIFLVFLLPWSAQCGDLEQFRAEMEKLISKLPKQNSASVEFQVLGQNKSLFSSKESKAMVPASTMKLLTALTAFHKLGENFSFTTNVYADGRVVGDTLQGNIVLQGNGDPYLVSERLWLLARDIARKGIKNIIGGVKVNNSAFAEDYRGLLDWDDSSEPFTALVSATSLNFNSVEVHITPSKSGDQPRVELGPVPHSYAKLLNKIKQVSGTKKSLSIHAVKREETKEIFELNGTIGRDADPVVLYASVSNGAAYIADAFAALLRAEGIAVGADFVGLATGDAQNILAKQDSLPLLDLARLYNTYSNNFMAEQVFLGLGAAVQGGVASPAKSRAVVLDYIHRNTACKDAEIDNGSGLSWKTRVSAKCFVEVLQSSYRDFSGFVDALGSMPVGGQTGTLKHRFKIFGDSLKPEKVRAKTGTLWSKHAVASLVGITQAASGEPVLFAILQNDARGDGGLLSGMRDWEERCMALVQRLHL